MSKILNILLQRNDTDYPWGFTIAGTPGALYIDKVSSGAISSQHLNVGDKVLNIAGIDSERIDVREAQELIDRRQRSLELTVVKINNSPRKFSDGSESIPSSSGSVPWRTSHRGSSISVDGRKAKNQFWERCSGLRSRNFYNSVDSDLSRMRDKHSRSHSLERDLSTTPSSFSSNTDLFLTSVASEPLWTRKTAKNRTTPNWVRTQSYTDDSTKLFPDTRAESKENLETSRDFSFTRQTSSPERNPFDDFKGFTLNKPGKFPWFDNFDDLNSTKSSKKVEEEEFQSKRSDMSSSSSERSFLRSYNKKEMKTYEFEESSTKSSGMNESSFKEEGKEYFYRRSGTFLEENSSSFDERNRPHTPAGFYENHKEESVKEERTFFDRRSKSVEREEISRRSYSRESTVERNLETTPSEAKEEYCSSSRTKEHNDGETSVRDVFTESKIIRSFSKSPTKIQIDLRSTSPAEDYLPFSNRDHRSNLTKIGTSSHSVEGRRQTDESSDNFQNNSTACFSKCISNNNDRRSIFDARKYWSCTSPTSESQFVFVPVHKPPDNPILHAKLHQINESQETSIDSSIGRSETSIEEKSSTNQSEQLNRPEPINMSSEPVPWRRQQNQISGGNSQAPTPPSTGPSFDSFPAPLQTAAPPPPPPPPSAGGAPPPPPPPIGLVHIPAIRLKSEIPDVRREPPAAIQNAMMKDKKPFTYTPGGIDLSEIRSPRMQRRISRNAQTTDSTQSPPVQQTSQPNRPVSLPPSAAAAMQPQIAIPVFPPTGPSINHSVPPPTPPINNFQSAPPPPPQPMAVPKMQPRQPQPPPPPPPQQNQNSGSIYVPPVQQQSQPRSQLGSLYIPPVHQQQQQQEIPSATPTPPAAHLNKAPTPWLSRPNQQQKEVPPWVNREDNSSSPVTSPNVQINQKQPQLSHQQQQPQARVIPIQIEGREPNQPNTRIIPITLEGTPSPKPNFNQPNFQQQQQYHPQQSVQQQQKFQNQQQQQRWPVYVHNKFNPSSASVTNGNSNLANGRSPQPTQQNWGGSADGSSSPLPVQSRSFRVLQKITDSSPFEGDQVDAPYNSQGVPLSQLRKLQLSDDDQALMNKVKTQVDEDNFLHTESEPRYRGAAIPSRAFRMLQNMTDNAGNVPQGPNESQLRSPNRRPPQESPSPAQPYVPPSEQQVQEPRMYTGSAIPSRSFRMLQAMTGPDPTGRPDESDY